MGEISAKTTERNVESNPVKLSREIKKKNSEAISSKTLE